MLKVYLNEIDEMVLMNLYISSNDTVERHPFCSEISILDYTDVDWPRKYPDKENSSKCVHDREKRKSMSSHLRTNTHIQTRTEGLNLYYERKQDDVYRLLILKSTCRKNIYVLHRMLFCIMYV
jgi:hypothetical protein